MAHMSLESPKTNYDHTERISERRKTLFPSSASSTASTDSDLGHMSPLYSVYSDEDGEEIHFLKSNLNDYVILDNIDGMSECSTFNPSPSLNQRSTTPVLYSPPLMPTNLLTPIADNSPSEKLKTPHDNTTVKMNTKQTKKKYEESSDELNKSKVRTALFADDDDDNINALPSKSFYPKTIVATPFVHRPTIICNDVQIVVKKRKRPTYSRRNNRCGRINAGVRHKIKKPKLKKANKEHIMKAALNIIEKSALNQYLEEFATLTPAFTNKTNNKENVGSSPRCDVVNESNKFFKSRPRRAVCRILNNVQIDVVPRSEAVIEEAPFSPEKEISVNVNKILETLKADWTDDSLDADDLLKKTQLILSPTSQMCDMTSGLALNSPKKAILNINKLLDTEPTSSFVDMAENCTQKLFPIFYPGHHHTTTNNNGKRAAAAAAANNDEDASSCKPPAAKRFKGLADNQMLLDAGQKRFGMTQCPECKLVYNMGSPNDEMDHLNYHNAVHIFKFNGWKNERVVSQIGSDARIIKIIPGDSKLWWKKLKDLVEVVNRDLGFYEDELPINHAHIYLYIKSKQIMGCLIAEQKDEGYKLVNDASSEIDLCSEKSYPIKCGVSRIWVSRNHRKKGIATSLMNILRTTFMFGSILHHNEIAFSSPTADGKAFACKYFQTNQFMIYM